MALMIKTTPRYVDHLWYPILVKVGGINKIVEMQGREVNAWNDLIQLQRENTHLRGCQL